MSAAVSAMQVCMYCDEPSPTPECSACQAISAQFEAQDGARRPEADAPYYSFRDREDYETGGCGYGRGPL